MFLRCNLQVVEPSYTIPPRKSVPSEDREEEVSEFIGTGNLEQGFWDRPGTRNTERSKQANLALPQSVASTSRVPKTRTLSVAEKAREQASVSTKDRLQARKDLFPTAVPVTDTTIELSSVSAPQSPAPSEEPSQVALPTSPTITTPQGSPPGAPVPLPPLGNPVPPNPVPPVKMANNHFKIPSPWDKNCPSFDGKSASSLQRFIRHCKMIIDQGGITDVKEQKVKFTDYVHDDDIREQWETLDHYKSGTLDEWVTSIEALYPEILDITSGSLEKLLRICGDNAGLERHQEGEVKRFSVAFLNEATKLMKAPAVLTDKELINMYLKCFEGSYAADIRVMMFQKVLLKIDNPATAAAAAAVAAPPANATTEVKRRGYNIPLKDVVAIAEMISANWTGGPDTRASYVPANLSANTVPAAPLARQLVPVKEEYDQKIESLSLALARVQDNTSLHDKKWDDRLTKMESSFKASFAQLQRGAAPHTETVRNNDQSGQQPSNREGQERGFRPQEDRKCFYCNKDHLIRDCRFKDEHIDMGRIVIENGLMKLANGQNIPRHPEWKSKKERVDDYYSQQEQNRPQVQSTMLQYNQYSQEEDRDSRVDHMYDHKTDEIRSMRIQNALQQSRFLNSAPQAPQVPSTATQQYIPIPSAVVPNGMDLTQFIQFVDAARNSAPSNGGQTQEQFVATRSGARSDPANPNF